MESGQSMRLRTLISLKTEPSLEKWARLFRYTKANEVLERQLSRKKSITLIDFGCGQDILYYKFITQVFPEAKNRLKYIGVDPLLKKATSPDKSVILLKSKFENVKLTEKADVITMFAVLEHVDDAAFLLQNAAKLLKPTGIIIITTPSPLARFPLEFLSYEMGVIARREIDEHKRYPDRTFLLKLNQKLSGLTLTQEYFEMGLNNFCLVSRKNTALPAYSLSQDLKLIVSVLKLAFRETNS